MDGKQAAMPAAGPIDYEEVYRGESPFRELIGARAPWDIGEPQPAVAELEEGERIGREVLDAGCGLGQNAVFLASRGHAVSAFDNAPTALGQARDEAAAHGVTVDFHLADATELPDFGRRFDTIVDSALYHCLGDRSRPAYIAALRERVKPGGTLHLLCFSDAQPRLSPAAASIGEAELHAVFATGWRITELRPATITTALSRAAIERSAMAAGMDARQVLESFAVDEQGRFLATAWLVSAQRV